MTLSFPMLGSGWCNLDGSVRACVNSEHRKAVRLREEEKGERERGEIGGDGRSSRGISCAPSGVDYIQVRSVLETPSGPIGFFSLLPLYWWKKKRGKGRVTFLESYRGECNPGERGYAKEDELGIRVRERVQRGCAPTQRAPQKWIDRGEKSIQMC